MPPDNPPIPADARLVPGLLDALRAAGDLLLDHQRDLGVLRIEDKAAGRGTQDLVSEADHAVDRLLRERLAALAPVPYWSEESGDRPDSRRFWLVDPLDGTNNFVNGMPMFGITVALMEDGGASIGASLFPALGNVAYAIRGAGAWFDGRRLALAPQPQAAWVVEVNTQPSDADQVRNMTALLGEVRAVRVLGSLALSLAWVAAGKLDLFVGRGHPWDVAAGMLMVEEAGGICRNPDRDEPRDPLRRELMLCGHPRAVGLARTRILG